MIRKKSFIFAFALFLGSRCEFSEDSDCSDIFHGMKQKPKDCCVQPMLRSKNTSMEHCEDDCKDVHEEKERKCCIFRCGAKTFKFLDDKEKVQTNGILKHFEESLEFSEDSTTVFPKEKYLPIIKKHLETCLKIVPLNRSEQHCKMPAALTWIIECIHHQNFLDCPYFNSNDNCKKTLELMKSGITHCGVNHDGHFVPYDEYYF